MKRVDVSVTSKTPLIVNRFHESAQLEATSGIHARKETVDPEEEVKSRLYMFPDGTPYYPAENLRQSIIDAGSRHKIGRKSAVYDLAAAVYILPEMMIIKGSYRVDSRPVVIPATHGRVIRHRPIFDEWSLDFIINYEEQLLDIKLLRAVVQDSGNFVGIGDFRPSRRGPYGRFDIVKWECS